jgi:hypothetical protein
LELRRTDYRGPSSQSFAMTFSSRRPNLAIMRQRPSLAWHRFHAQAFAGMMLAAVPFARADDSLSREQAEALQTRKIAAAMTNGIGIPQISLGLVPKELKVESAKVSLIPDLKDSEGALIAVYLTNGSEQPLWGADSNYAHCFLEVKDGNRWRACERFIPGCFTGEFPQPERLPAGQAKIFLGINPNQGDMTGELRFCIVLPDVRPIVSASFQGRFSSKRFEEAAPIANPVSKAIADGFADKGLKSDGSPKGVARSPEEYIAAAELERCYDESSATKTALIRWQASAAAAGENMAQTARQWRPCWSGHGIVSKTPPRSSSDASPHSPAMAERMLNLVRPSAPARWFGATSASFAAPSSKSSSIPSGGTNCRRSSDREIHGASTKSASRPSSRKRPQAFALQIAKNARLPALSSIRPQAGRWGLDHRDCLQRTLRRYGNGAAASRTAIDVA